MLVACVPAKRESRDTLTVFAAASLSEAFRAIAAAYGQEHGETDIILNLAGSQQLAQQLAQGAPADVFASASVEQLRVAQEAGRVTAGTDSIFVMNQLVVITPPGATTIAILADLARPGVRVILADEAVPAGQYSRVFLERASGPGGLGDGYEKSVLENVVSYEQNVRAVLTKIALGEADAGIVYESDVVASDVGQIRIADDMNVIANYPIAPISDSRQPALAARFVEYVLSPRGQAILEGYGFKPVRVQSP